MNNFQIALDFTKKVKKLKNKSIKQIILFGSVARNEDTLRSDIDIAIIHSLKNPDKIKTQINSFLNEKIQLTYLHINQLPNETELVSALTGEGILLYGHPLNIKLKSNELKPKTLIVYDTSELTLNKRMKLNRALHVSVSKSTYKNKEYVTKTTGIIEEKGIQKLTRAVIIAEPKKANRIIKTLKLFNAKWKEISIWT